MTRFNLVFLFLTSITPQQEPVEPKTIIEEAVTPKVRVFADVPVIWPVKGKINSGYGYRFDPFTKHNSFHTGLDISGKLGQAVYAPADGKVVWAKRMKEYGNLLIIEHANGITTWYGHLSIFTVNVGDSVLRGDKIGEMGMTGLATGCHLHLEIRINDQPVDPTKFILDTLTDRLSDE